MVAWRVLGSLGVLLAGVTLARAQKVTLAEPLEKGDCLAVRLEMKLAGQLRIAKGGTTVPLPLQAEARHAYPERVLELGKDGTPAKVARLYETARADFQVNGGSAAHTLRPQRRLVVAQRHQDRGLAYCPTGPLTREEADLVGKHFDTLALPGLLPGKDLAAGETWKVSTPVVQALCGFDGVTGHTLQGKLETVTDREATFSVAGTATGIELGALVKVEVRAAGRFDRASQRITRLEWTQKDEREQGPASPASTVEATTRVERRAVALPEGLSDVALISVPGGLEVPEGLAHLSYRDPQGKYALRYERGWHVTARSEEHLVMRLMDRGTFVAQVTVTPWTDAAPGKHLSPADFREAMDQTFGWRPEKELQAGEVPAGDGRWTYRLSYLGHLDGVEVMQHFYLLAAPSGRQVVVAFTLTPKQAEKLAGRDLVLVAGLEVLPPARR
jgi:hypothetical protein